MKKIAVNLIIYGIIFLPFSANAATFATQDLFLIDSLKINDNEGNEIDLINEIINTALESTNNSITFSGGAIFQETTAFGDGLLVDTEAKIIPNTIINAGVISFEEESVFGILSSSDIDQKKETLGISDSIQLDLTSVFPDYVNIGDTGSMNYSMIQLLKPTNTDTENNLSTLEIAASRVEAGFVNIPSLDGVNLAYGENIPFVIADGSNAWRWFGKGLQIIGDSITGGIQGAGVGAAIGVPIGAAAGGIPSGGIGAVPGAGVGAAAGGVIGGGIGGIGAGLSSTGKAIERNTEDDDTPDPEPPESLIPPDKEAVPVPEPITGLIFAAGIGGAALKRAKNKSKQN